MSLRPIDRFNAPKTTLQTQDLVQKRRFVFLLRPIDEICCASAV